MPDWLWVLCIFVALTFGYATGFAAGSWKSEAEINACPSENAYIREAEIMAQTNERIEIRKAEIVTQAAIERYRIAAQKAQEEMGKYSTDAKTKNG